MSTQPIPMPTGHLRCNAGGHVVGAEILPGIQVVTASHRVIVGRMLKISCRDGCPGVWESPEIALIARVLEQVPQSETADQLRTLLGIADGASAKAAA